MEVENNENYDSLYDKGFDEGITDIEEVVEPEDEPNEETDEETEEQPDVEQVDEETETPEPDEEVSEEVEDTDDTDSEEPKLYEVKHNGQVMKLTEEEVILMANKGFDYTAKTQDLSSKRRTLDIIDGIDDNILQSLKDAKSGNKEAFAKLAEEMGIDPYDVDVENSNYKPVVEDKNYALNDVIEKINRDTDNATILNGWVQNIPKKSQDFLADNPVILDELYQHTVSGVAKNVMPEVMKQMAINPQLDFMSTYNQIYSVLQEKPKEVPKAKPQVSKEVKKKATISKAKSNSKINDHKDIWEDDELYAQMQKMRQR